MLLMNWVLILIMELYPYPLRSAIVNPQVKGPTGVFYSDTLNWMRIQGLYTATSPLYLLDFRKFQNRLPQIIH